MMTSLIPHRTWSLLIALSLLAPIGALAQAAPEDPSTNQPDERSTGLPPQIKWTFNFDATWGTFGFANSLYQDPKENVPANLSDQWFEGSIKPALSGVFTLANSSQFYGKVSGVGERTYGSAPEAFGPDVSSFQVDDLAIGWRSGKLLDVGENALDFTLGRAPYRLGHGFLLYDGAAEGGSRGGYWSNVRKAFGFATIGRFHAGPHNVEAFYLDKDELPENDTGTRLGGTNYEFSLGAHSTFGATYMKTFAHADMKPGRDGLNVFNIRAYTAPIPGAPDLSFEFEHAFERNGDVLHAYAWTLQEAYQLSNVAWKPKVSYRYASFQGDDPATSRNENFDPLLLGFYDWGTWWQGEIAGEFFLSNSNLISHQVRVHAAPSDVISGGLIFYKFNLNQPASFAPGVTNKNLAFETDLYVDWKINKHFTASFVTAFANPDTAAQQAFNRTKNFGYGMVFLAYSY